MLPFPLLRPPSVSSQRDRRPWPALGSSEQLNPLTVPPPLLWKARTRRRLKKALIRAGLEICSRLLRLACFPVPVQAVFKQFANIPGMGGTSENVITDEAELERHKELEFLYGATKSSKVRPQTCSAAACMQYSLLTEASSSPMCRHSALGCIEGVDPWLGWLGSSPAASLCIVSVESRLRSFGAAGSADKTKELGL